MNMSRTKNPPRSTSPARVLVVGGSPERPLPPLLRALAMQSRAVVACDSGADACRLADVRVDVLVGDDDSLSDEGAAYVDSCGAERIGYPQDKDNVDLELAIEYVRRTYGDVHLTLTGVSGARLDHGLAALGCIVRASDLLPVVEENDVTITVLDAEHRKRWVAAPSDVGRTLSVMAVAFDTVVSEHGMRWNLDAEHLGVLEDRGVSNIVEQRDAFVEVTSGKAVVVVLRDRVVKHR